MDSRMDYKSVVDGVTKVASSKIMACFTQSDVEGVAEIYVTLKPSVMDSVRFESMNFKPNDMVESDKHGPLS